MTLSPGPHWPLLLSRPVWMRGAEMGINARGVVVGNEAVFSRWKPARDGVLGMDILRQALEEAGTAEEAVDFIGHFTETHTQGGNGAYRGKLFYDNSYLAADFAEAWIIETAGRRWAAHRLTAPGAISNCYSIEDDFDRCDPATAAEKRPGYSWRRRVSNRVYGLIAQGDFRRAFSLSRIRTPGATIETVFSALRSHGARVSGTRSLCMHGGGLVNNATTSSMVVEMRAEERRAIIWFTASSMPCVSLYRAAVLENGSFCPLWKDYDYAEGSPRSLEYWKRRRLATRLLEGWAPQDLEFARRRDDAQSRLVGMVASRTGPAGDAALSAHISTSVTDFER